MSEVYDFAKKYKKTTKCDVARIVDAYHVALRYYNYDSSVFFTKDSLLEIAQCVHPGNEYRSSDFYIWDVIVPNLLERLTDITDNYDIDDFYSDMTHSLFFQYENEIIAIIIWNVGSGHDDEPVLPKRIR